ERAQRLLSPQVYPGDLKGLFEGIFLVTLNRRASQALFESRSTVKADAAHRVFAIDTTGIAFAVLQSPGRRGYDSHRGSGQHRLRRRRVRQKTEPRYRLPGDQHR